MAEPKNMTLAQWRQAEGLTQEELAERLGCVKPTINRYESGARVPEWDMMKAIYIASEGKVPPNSFFPLEEWEAERFEAEVAAEKASMAA